MQGGEGGKEKQKWLRHFPEKALIPEDGCWCPERGREIPKVMGIPCESISSEQRGLEEVLKNSLQKMLVTFKCPCVSEREPPNGEDWSCH